MSWDDLIGKLMKLWVTVALLAMIAISIAATVGIVMFALSLK